MQANNSPLKENDDEGDSALLCDFESRKEEESRVIAVSEVSRTDLKRRYWFISISECRELACSNTIVDLMFDQ